MILEQLCIADIAAERVDGLVPGYVHHLENRGAVGSCRSQKPRPERMTGKHGCVQAGARGVRLRILATDRSVRRPERNLLASPIGRKIAPASIPAARSQARNALTGQATSPREIAMTSPASS